MDDDPTSNGMPEFELSGEVKAREARYDARGPSGVRFWGRPGVSSMWRSFRFGLPETVQPGVTYRDVEAGSQWSAGVRPQGGVSQVQEHEHGRPPPSLRAADEDSTDADDGATPAGADNAS